MIRCLALALAFIVPAGLLAQAPAGFVVTKTPNYNGLRATADLPASQHHRNVGGSDGAGLCVYTSFWHAAIWQTVSDVYEFRAYMERRPGGSYPQKFDSTLAAYCKSKGVPVPSYVQHTGGDVEFLKLALKTGRMVCVTYCGVDGAGRYGSEVIAHMVNLVYLDDQYAAILDNNFPGTWLWMPAKEFIARWTGIATNGSPYRIRRSPIGGGWAIVLLESPPAPYPIKPVAADLEDGGDQLLIGQIFRRNQSCPNGQCQNGECISNGNPPGYGDAPEGFEWVYYPNLRAWGLRPLPAPAVAAPPIAIAPMPMELGQTRDPFPGGVVFDKIDPTETYTHKGKKVSRAWIFAAFAAALSDDSAKWNLEVVGDPSFLARVRSDVAALEPSLRDKLHFHAYAPTDWPVSQFSLLPGVTLRKPAVNRVGADCGVVDTASYSPAKLAALLAPVNGITPQPLPPAPQPQPAPAPNPDPKKPDQPSPTPEPTPAPAPAPNQSSLALALAAILGLLVWIFRR